MNVSSGIVIFRVIIQPRQPAAIAPRRQYRGREQHEFVGIVEVRIEQDFINRPDNYGGLWRRYIRYARLLLHFFHL